MRDAVGDVQSILLLGGSSEIGLAIVRRLSGRRRADVILAGRKPEKLSPHADEVRAAGAGEVTTVEFDADDVGTHSAFAEQVFSGRDIDLAILAAGVLGDQASDELDPVRAAAVLQTNFVGCASAALAVANQMRRQGHGSLVVLSSVAAERVRRANFIYGASKAGLDGFAQGLGDSLVGTGVRVVIVRPGFVRTKMTAGRPDRPMTIEPEGVAATVETALRRGQEIVWAPPRLRLVMAVARHLPRAIFRRLPF